MPKMLDRQTSNPQRQVAIAASSEGTPYGDAVVIDGVDRGAARRAHMRAQTTARQAIDRRYHRPVSPTRYADRADVVSSLQVRELERQAALADLASTGEAWLEAWVRGRPE